MKRTKYLLIGGGLASSQAARQLRDLDPEVPMLTAYFAINPTAKELPALQQLIRSRKDLSGSEDRLADPAVPVKSLL
jgi:hypothetical protein